MPILLCLYTYMLYNVWLCLLSEYYNILIFPKKFGDIFPILFLNNSTQNSSIVCWNTMPLIRSPCTFILLKLMEFVLNVQILPIKMLAHSNTSYTFRSLHCHFRVLTFLEKKSHYYHSRWFFENCFFLQSKIGPILCS